MNILTVFTSNIPYYHIQTFQPSEKPKLQVNYVYLPQRLKSQHNYSLVSLFKMSFDIIDIHVNGR